MTEDVAAGSAPAPDFDPVLMAVLSSRFEAIIREMVNTVMKSSRSTTITNARDFSCGLLTYDHRLVCVEEAMPIHVTALELTTAPITRLFDDVKEGDAFYSTSPYYGVTHHADMTACVPVFCDGEPLFWTLARSHHTDTGAHLPTTMDAYFRTVYEEGLHIPALRFQENYADKADLIRLCRENFRVSHLWYGDYRAQMAACRVGERRLKELSAQYGLDLLKDFVAAWMAYGERRAIAAIRELPAGTWSHTCTHDPIPGVAEDGIPITAHVTTDPEGGWVTVDLRDNPDCVPGGVNLSEACATGSGRIGVFYNLDPTIPHNAGSAGRIRVLLRDGCVVGRPTYPVGTSNATMGVNDRLINAIQTAFAKMGAPYGLAEGGVEFGSNMGLISGTDDRHGDPQPFVDGLFLALAGGPGLHGHDGWLTYEAPNGGGILAIDAIETDEAKYPVLVESRHVAKEAMGAGQWNGAPSMEGSYRPLRGPITVAYCSDGETNPPRGVLGGGDAAPARNVKRLADGGEKRLPGFHLETCAPGERMCFRTAGGGGYGDPHARDPQAVAADANRHWLSPERAEALYGVALRLAGNGVDWEVDGDRTAALRQR
ncbi:hydantoinase B/oxoprolinase family protein [Marinibaculum pumilum]|uniref:Hydantoinase B/oxoprolinase family protein n=1 Tax=Marinibaculum pumilum TaxID=1766165 RepID=A0ABV7L5G9_9PROT